MHGEQSAGEERFFMSMFQALPFFSIYLIELRPAQENLACHTSRMSSPFPEVLRACLPALCNSIAYILSLCILNHSGCSSFSRRNPFREQYCMTINHHHVDQKPIQSVCEQRQNRVQLHLLRYTRKSHFLFLLACLTSYSFWLVDFMTLD